MLFLGSAENTKRESEMKTYTYEIGASYRRSFMIRLDELGLPYSEHRTMFGSTIIVKTYTEAHEDAFWEFQLDVQDFQRRLKENKRKQAERKQEKLRKEQAEKLASKNRFRKLTFRKPLKSL